MTKKTAIRIQSVVEHLSIFMILSNELLPLIKVSKIIDITSVKMRLSFLDWQWPLSLFNMEFI